MPLPFKILGIDHIFCIVGNAKQACYFYQTLFGFEPFAYRGLETGDKKEVSYALRQNKITLVLASPLSEQSPLNDHLQVHGDAVKSIALLVDDAGETYDHAMENGAISVQEPVLIPDDFGVVTVGTVKLHGDTDLTFLERHKYEGVFMPGYKSFQSHLAVPPTGLTEVDHIVANLPQSHLERMARWYEQKLGFHRFWKADNTEICTEYTALHAVALTDENERVKFALNQPAECMRISQVEEFLKFYAGPGVQHIAFDSQNIIKSAAQLKENGVEFLQSPDDYYEELPKRMPDIEENIEELKRLNIMVDRDESGYLLQVFTKPIQDRPTLFFEIIQRKGAQSFGKVNFKTLFEAIEREQEQRKTL